MKLGLSPQISNAAYYQKMGYGICSLTIVKFKINHKSQGIIIMFWDFLCIFVGQK